MELTGSDEEHSGHRGMSFPAGAVRSPYSSNTKTLHSQWDWGTAS